jgi:hypothetical protein
MQRLLSVCASPSCESGRSAERLLGKVEALQFSDISKPSTHAKKHAVKPKAVQQSRTWIWHVLSSNIRYPFNTSSTAVQDNY